ncbi:MAG: hypothetical protein OES13_00325 [Acidimicrobiia bacterium]|nr:hypothetical protein [Acidimicrobiia bacterium]
MANKNPSTELCTFAVRIPAEERASIHAAAERILGKGKGTRYASTVLRLASTGKMDELRTFLGGTVTETNGQPKPKGKKAKAAKAKTNGAAKNDLATEDGIEPGAIVQVRDSGMSQGFYIVREVGSNSFTGCGRTGSGKWSRTKKSFPLDSAEVVDPKAWRATVKSGADKGAA